MSKKSLIEIARDAANKTPMDEEDIILLGVEFLKDRGFVFAKIAKLESELAALREKYRWRKQSEEPAPKDEYILVCNNGAGLHGYTLPMLAIYRKCSTYFYEYWRPLDMPEALK